MGRDTYYDRFKKQKSSSFKQVRHFIEYLALIAVRGFVSLFPIHWNQKLGSRFGHLAMKLATKDRGIADYQLGFCFPDLSDVERQCLLKKSFCNIGTTLFETLVINKFRNAPADWIRFENEQVIFENLNQGKGLILMFGHVGNWELFSLIFEMLNIKGITVSSTIGDTKLDRLLLNTRDSSNIRTIHRGDKQSAREILRCFRSNEVFLFAMDQDTRVKTIFVDFFGRQAATAIGAATLAQKFGAPVVSGFGARMNDGTHLYRFDLLSAQPYQGTEGEIKELTLKYNKALESHIRKYPDQWVWFHRRWKNQPGD